MRKINDYFYTNIQIYSSATKDNNAKRHHTGHFRHSSAEVWDPHPQYEFTAFGKHLRLILAQDNSFVSQDVKVILLFFILLIITIIDK